MWRAGYQSRSSAAFHSAEPDGPRKGSPSSGLGLGFRPCPSRPFLDSFAPSVRVGGEPGALLPLTSIYGLMSETAGRPRA